jgi:hypothetical protein
VVEGENVSEEEMHGILDAMVDEDYPLQVDARKAEACRMAIRAIMDAVPAEDRILLRGHYSLVTEALCHPSGLGPRRNEMVDL